MFCSHCHRQIVNKEHYIKFRIPGVTDQLYFHFRNDHDCWHAFVRQNPTIRVMEVTMEGLIEHKTEYYS